ncbi:GNAT family N-acetyltransferase [Tateyamaria sp. SN6-1]|uniref:GNAT family N-acetyltransferase n=1 Tax=Tateyamaria sp. SN6-1 TaxID=3092148 RepID=UPI0039F60628
MTWGGFDPQPWLEGRTIRLRPLASQDRDALYAAASDPRVWDQHPARNRHDRAVFDPYFDFLLSRKAALCVLSRDTDRVIGTSSFYLTPETPPAASIGFTFLARDRWGGPTNAEMKALMLDHMFTVFDTVSLHIAPGNLRSQKATEKLGAVRMADRTLDLGNGPEDLVTYALDCATWQAMATP